MPQTSDDSLFDSLCPLVLSDVKVRYKSDFQLITTFHVCVNDQRLERTANIESSDMYVNSHITPANQ